MKKVTLILFVTLQSCLMPPMTTNKVDLALESIEHEGDGYNGANSFQDSLISIKWMYGITSVNFTLQNRSNKTIKVIWEEASYIDENGESNRVMHTGVKYTDRSQSQPPTTVVRGATLNDAVVPTKNVRYVSGQYGGWVEMALFSSGSWSLGETKEYFDSLRGKKVSIMLPIMSEGRTREYLYTFVIK